MENNNGFNGVDLEKFADILRLKDSKSLNGFMASLQENISNQAKHNKQSEQDNPYLVSSEEFRKSLNASVEDFDEFMETFMVDKSQNIGGGIGIITISPDKAREEYYKFMDNKYGKTELENRNQDERKQAKVDLENGFQFVSNVPKNTTTLSMKPCPEYNSISRFTQNLFSSMNITDINFIIALDKAIMSVHNTISLEYIYPKVLVDSLINSVVIVKESEEIENMELTNFFNMMFAKNKKFTYEPPKVKDFLSFVEEEKELAKSDSKPNLLHIQDDNYIDLEQFVLYISE